MGNINLGENIILRDDLIRKTCRLAMKAHKSHNKLFCFERSSKSLEVVFSFGGPWSVQDWSTDTDSPFGMVEVDLQLLASLKNVNTSKPASVYESVLQRLKTILSKGKFKDEVDKAIEEGKRVVFTGHSSGGPIAVLATLWFFEHYVRPESNRLRPLCVTFGSLLVGNHVLNQAIRRENWSCYFIHFIMRYDIVPRISLTPMSSVEFQVQLQQIFQFFKSPVAEAPSELLDFFETVMSSISSVVNYTLSKLIKKKDPMLKMLANFVEISPYRPSGTYLFCIGNGELVIVDNPDAVLQLLVYSLQLGPADSVTQIAHRSLTDHLDYVHEVKECLNMISVTHLDNLDKIPLSDHDSIESSATNKALNDLGLSSRSRLCLRASAELEKRKMENLKKINKMKEDKNDGITKLLEDLENYKSKYDARNICYYDAFKKSRDNDDFYATAAMLQLGGIWSTIIALLVSHELPDRFEGRDDWIELATRYRRLVEPLEIAQYYGQVLNKDTGPYMGNGRSRRYKIAQRWLEHAKIMQEESLESCFWAEVEELRLKADKPNTKEDVLRLSYRIHKWINDGVLDHHMFWEGSTFMKLLKEHSIIE